MATNIQVLIIEDDPQVSLRTESLVYSLGYNIQRTVDNAKDAFSAIKKNIPDLLVVDINIKGPINGIELVESIKGLEIPVIYVTGNEDKETYNQARGTHPAAYLVKPFNKLTFQIAIENAIASLSEGTSIDRNQKEWDEEVWLKDSFFVKRNNLLQKVKIDDIKFIQSDGNYCDIIASHKYAVKMSLVQLLKKLPKDRFARIHQRFVVQTSKIDNIDLRANEIYIDGTPLPVGPKFKEPMFTKLNRLT